MVILPRYVQAWLLVGLALATGAAAQVRYRDEVFTQVTVDTAVQFGESMNLQGVSQKLYLDFYQPAGDTETKRPLLIWIHGGGFVGGNRADGRFYCERFAKRGYAAASIDYRLGIEAPRDSIKFMEELLRAVQDCKAAVRFFRGRAEFYRVDTTHVFAGGGSAGGITAVHVAYWDQEEIPAAVNQARWGNLEGASGNPGHSSVVQAALNAWGAIMDTTWIKAGEPPIAGFHGLKDPVVPYNIGYEGRGFLIFGSAAISRAATRAGIYNELTLIPDMLHGTGNNRVLQDSLFNFFSKFLFTVMSPATAVKTQTGLPSAFRLEQNYPNPFWSAATSRSAGNPSTTIRFALPQREHVTLKVFDALGREVATLVEGEMNAGEHSVVFDAKELPSGVYLYRLQTGLLVQQKKMVVTK